MDHQNYHFRLGAFNCIAVIDSTGLGGETTSFFANAPADERAAACRAHGIEGGQVTLDLACLFVDTGSHRVLVDTGAGANPDPNLGGLQNRLVTEQIAPESIDTVVLTHWHWDHVWGNTRPDGSLAYPNARFVMWRTEWEWATSEATEQAMLDVGGERSRLNLLAVKDRLLLLDQETEFMPGMWAVPAPGHTVGQMGLLIASEGQQLLCIGDVAHHPIHVEHPDWHTDFEFAADQSVATRRALLARAAAGQMLVFSPHLPPMGIGRVSGPRDGWRWQPAV